MESNHDGNHNDNRKSARPPLPEGNNKRRKTKNLEQKIEQENQRKNEENQRLNEEIQRLKEQLQRSKEQNKLDDGTYFTTIQTLWDIEIGGALNEANEEYKMLLQGRPKPDFQKEDGIYASRHHEEQMCNLPEETKCLVLTDKSDHHRSSICSEEKLKIWPKNVLNKSVEGEIVRHLLPHSYSNAATYWFLPPWLYSGTEDWTWDKRMKVLLGGRKEDVNKRQKFTGILHSVCNKARICGQKECMDDEPCLIIAPILSLDEVVQWKDGGYDAIMVIGTTSGKSNIKHIAQYTHMNENDDIVCADNDEIKKATNLLRFFLQAIFTATRRVPDLTQDTTTQSIIDQAKRVSDLQEVILPSLKQTNKFKVRKIRFEAFSKTPNDHPAPDPMLLVMKACAVFSTRTEQNMVANSEPKEDNWDEMDYIALDNFIEYQQQRLKPSSNWDILAKQLGQPGASRPENWNEGIVGPRDL